MKILVLLSRVPYPLEKGDKLRAYQMMVRLAKRHEVHVLCLSDQPTLPEHEAHLRTFCHGLQVVRLGRALIFWKLLRASMGRLPYQVAYFYDRRVQRIVDETIASLRPDHVFCQLVRTTEYVRRYHHLPKTLDYMDTLSKGMERRTEKAPRWLRPLFRAETHRLIAYENRMFDLFDHQVIISAQDRDHIYHPLRERMAVIPNGVDARFFEPVARTETHDLLFTGNMNYPPNVASVVFLVREVLPLVRQKRPGTTLLICGVDPSPRVKQLAARDSSVSVSGWVQDMRSAYASARVFVAPMLIGTGLQNKLLEAMATGMPCITSPLANNALGAPEGEVILIGRTAEEHAEHILALLGDRERAERVAQAGQRFVAERFNWDKAAQALERILTQPEPA
jgi:polysaccharide biosynthesis protein PslH